MTELFSLGASESWLSRREPRLRIVTALLAALITVNLTHITPLLMTLGLGVGLALSAGLTLHLLMRRLLALEGFMGILLLLMPFSVPGHPIGSLGPFPFSEEGVWLAMTILLKANAVAITLLSLIGTLEPVVLGHALAKLRLPDKLVHLLLFTVRYLGVLQEEFAGLRQAMRVRGFRARSNLHTWQSFGWLIGMLLVRSLERAERILAAMKCRGFQGRFYLLEDYPWRWADSGFALCTGILLGALLMLDRIP